MRRTPSSLGTIAALPSVLVAAAIGLVSAGCCAVMGAGMMAMAREVCMPKQDTGGTERHGTISGGTVGGNSGDDVPPTIPAAPAAGDGGAPAPVNDEP